MKNNKNNKNVLERLSNFAFIMAIIGICTVGICPAFGAMAVSVPLVMKNKSAEISEEVKSKNKKALIGGIVSLCLFIVDLVLAVILMDKF